MNLRIKIGNLESRFKRVEGLCIAWGLNWVLAVVLLKGFRNLDQKFRVRGVERFVYRLGFELSFGCCIAQRIGEFRSEF
jgi:hypothetical protein